MGADYWTLIVHIPPKGSYFFYGSGFCPINFKKSLNLNINFEHNHQQQILVIDQFYQAQEKYHNTNRYPSCSGKHSSNISNIY